MDHLDRAAQVEYALRCPAIAVAPQNLNGSSLAFSGRCLLRGWVIQNANAAQQTFQLLDGQDSSGQVIASLTLGTGARSQGPAADTAILLDIGLFVVIPAGPFQGAIFITPVTDNAALFGGH